MARTTTINGRLAALLRAFCLDERGFSIFELCKLAYLAEWEYMRHFGETFSGTPYVRIEKGPVFPQYADRIRDRELSGVGLTPHDWAYRYPVDASVEEVLATVSLPEELVVISHIVVTLKAWYDEAGRDSELLKNEAYSTPPMLRLLEAETKIGVKMGREILEGPYVRKKQDFHPDYRLNHAMVTGRRKALAYLREHPDAGMHHLDIGSSDPDNEFDAAALPFVMGMAASMDADCE